MPNSESNSNILTKALSILEYISRQNHKVSIQEISLELDIPSPTVHRILQILKAEGYVRQHSNKQYSLTYKLLALSGYSLSNSSLLPQILPFMNYFAQQKHCQVGLSVFHEESIIHLATVGNAIINNDKYALPGTVLPAYCTAAGKLFLAGLEEKELQTWIENRNLVPYTVKTVIDPAELMEQIRLTRERGYGVVIGELYDFVACVSIPVRNTKQHIIGALNFSCRPERFDEIYNDEFIASVHHALRNANFR